MKRPLPTIILLILTFVFYSSCKKKGESPVYSFTSLEIANASSHAKTPQKSWATTISAGIYGIEINLNLDAEIVSKAGTDTRNPMSNNTPIQEVVITSNEDFNSNFLAGDTLNSFFRIYNGNYFKVVKLTDFEAGDFQDLTYYYDGPFAFQRYLLLSEKPSFLGLRKFYVKMITNSSILLDSVEINLN